MGGLVARARVKADFPRKYVRVANFNKGDFHKIITVGTPHRGTPVADWLLERRNQVSNLGGQVGVTFQQLFERIKKPLGPAILGFISGAKRSGI
jgi:triacylglycerol esterase/lipase EstA (alpha/beta hydrolase family)